MKAIKRIAGILLALVMVFAVATTAFAGETGTITVTNPIKGQNYTAYKIFDVSYNADKDAFSYSIAANSEWYDVVKDFNGLTFTKVGDRYTVKMTADFSAAEFSKLLKKNCTGKAGTALAAESEGAPATASGLDLGYYFVASTTGALCNLTTTTPTATIRDKNDMPFEKEDDKSTVQVGDVVNYKITAKVPDATGFDDYTYLIEDTMTEGLTFEGPVTVTVGGTDITGKYTYEKVGNGFKLQIDVMALQKEHVGAEILVTYSATVNEQAVSKISKNSAKLTYSNDPTDSESKTTTPPVEETVYTAKIVINKYDADHTDKTLAGAKFVLKNADGKYYSYDKENKKVNWVDKAEAEEVTTDDDGAASFIGLKDGTYFLEETAAPAGYNPLTSAVEVTIDGSTASETKLEPLTVKADVANNTGTTLPETGGIGTTIFYVIGGMLVLGAAVLLITKKRLSAEK